MGVPFCPDSKCWATKHDEAVTVSEFLSSCDWGHVHPCRVAHFFISAGGSFFRWRVAHFFVDIYNHVKLPAAINVLPFILEVTIKRMWDAPFDLSMLADENRNLIVSCSTEELAEEFVRIIHEHGVSWAGREGSGYTHWDTYKESIRYFVERDRLTYSNKEWADEDIYENHIKARFYSVDTPDFETASDDELVALLGIGGT